MKIRVKVLMLSLAMGMLLSMTTACWEDLVAKSKGESGLVGGINGSPLSNDPSTKLTFSINELPADFERVADEIEMRSRNTLNIELNFKNVEYDEFRIEKIAKLFISSDAVLLPSEPALRYCAGRDFLADITELLPQYAPHIYSLLSEDALKQVTFDNKVAAIPSLISYTNRLYVIAQKSLVDKYYIENISSFEEFESFLSTIRKNRNRIIFHVFQIL